MRDALVKPKFQIVTNNPLVRERYGEMFEVTFLDVSIKSIMETVRDMCLDGHELLTHPLSGSVKPGETPYKSILVSLHKGSADMDGYKKCQTAVDACEKFKDMDKFRSPSVLDDFQLVDYTLISSGIESARA